MTDETEMLHSRTQYSHQNLEDLRLRLRLTLQQVYDPKVASRGVTEWLDQNMFMCHNGSVRVKN